MIILHCDSCGKPLGTYLYGNGGIEEKAFIKNQYSHRLPDIICKNCFKKGYDIENPKYPEKVFGKKVIKWIQKKRLSI